MEYVLPKDLSNKFSISLQTVYNYLNKHEGSIRTKKDFGKTFIHAGDFSNYFQSSQNSFEKPTENIELKKGNDDIENLKTSIKELETDRSALLQENESLQKYNVNLQDQTSKYALMFSEEKKEKQQLMAKYDTIQKEYHEKTESLLREKVLIEKKYYLLLGISIVVIVFLAWILLAENLTNLFSN